MTAITGSAAAITGAASGIGKALAQELASRGCDVAIADRDEAGLKAVAEEIGQSGRARVTVHRVDVADPEQIAAFAVSATSLHPRLNILINNAGVALFGQFHEIDHAQIERLMQVNFWGVVRGVSAFMPYLAQCDEPHIVNVSSVFGMVAPPGQTAYAASKFAVRGFSESLRHELELNGSRVRLSVVHPGGVSTNVARNAAMGTGITDNLRRAQSIDRFDQIAKTTPQTAAQRIVRGIERNEKRILIGSDARMIDIVHRLVPVRYWNVLGRKFAKAIDDKNKPDA